jgi:hypothetical protein
MLDISDDDWFFNNKLDGSEMFNEEGDLSINNDKFFLDGSEWYNFFNEDWFLFDDLFENWNLGMTGNLYYFLLHIWLHEMAFLNDDFFWDFLINGFLDLYDHGLGFLAITVIRIVYGFLHEYFYNFSNF